MAQESNRAPHWIRQIADSLIILAAALSIVGIDFEPYFEARSKIEILRMELDLESRKVNPDFEKRLAEAEKLLVKVDKLSHKESK
jgi:hypothetical protein